jgi:hypothetical protein
MIDCNLDFGHASSSLEIIVARRPRRCWFSDWSLGDAWRTLENKPKTLVSLRRPKIAR